MSVPWSGIKPKPWYWKPGILTTGPLRTTLKFLYIPMCYVPWKDRGQKVNSYTQEEGPCPSSWKIGGGGARKGHLMKNWGMGFWQSVSWGENLPTTFLRKCVDASRGPTWRCRRKWRRPWGSWPRPSGAGSPAKRTRPRPLLMPSPLEGFPLSLYLPRKKWVSCALEMLSFLVSSNSWKGFQGGTKGEESQTDDQECSETPNSGYC